MGSNELLTTSQAAKLAAVGSSTIKRWADQGTLPYVRTAGGHRRFARASVEQLLRAVQPTDIPSTSRASATELPAPLSGLPPPATRQPSALRPSGDGTSTSRARSWCETLTRAQRHELDGQLLAARARLGRWSEVADEVAGGLYELGLAWERGELSIAEEHVASEQLARALARVGDTLPTPLVGPRVLLASVPAEEHTLGLSLAELCTREAGATPVWLGRRTPVDELMRVLSTDGARVVVLAASVVCQDELALARVADDVGAMCRRRGAALVLGGAGAWPRANAAGTRVTSFRQYAALLSRELAVAEGAAR